MEATQLRTLQHRRVSRPNYTYLLAGTNNNAGTFPAAHGRGPPHCETPLRWLVAVVVVVAVAVVVAAVFFLVATQLFIRIGCQQTTDNFFICQSL